MLQTRFENEQFSSSSNIFKISGSQNDFMSTARPDSSQVFF
jgi:hypothetical protein